MKTRMAKKETIHQGCKKAIISSALGLCAVFAVAQTTTQTSAKEMVEIGSIKEPLGGVYKAPAQLKKGVGRVVFYRADQGGKGVVGLRINTHYHTSLQAGSYSELCISPATIGLVARHNELGTPVNAYENTAKQIEVVANQTTFIKLVDADGLVRAIEVEQARALQEVETTRLQMHTATRVPGAQDCEARAVEPKSAEGQTITLGADALFSFGKSDPKSISEKGRTSLDKLVHRLQDKYGDFEQVSLHIIGHADPIGQPAQNKALSEARAKSIREYMIARGIPAQKITSEGVGDTNPIYRECGNTPTPENIGCNTPNRRVVVDVRVKTGK